MELKIKRLTEEAVIPTRAHVGDAGLDLYSLEEYTLQPLERHLFKTGIAFGIPPGHYGQISDRSGNAYKRGLTVLGGVIDETFSGEISVILYNTGDGVQISKGEKLAQIIILPYVAPDMVEVEELVESSRGARGFGSSGN